MKNLFIGFGVFVVILLSAFSLLALNTNTTKQSKLTMSTRTAAYQAVQECAENGANAPQTQDELTARFCSLLATQLNTNDQVDVKVLGSDVKEGMLSVEVVQHYKNMGKEKEARTTETVIYDQTNKVN